MSERILIVEDEAAIQAVLYELLTSQGYEVVVSGDGLDGLTKFREQNFSLVLLDIMMPKIDGFTVCEAIRRESSTPVIMLTALDEEEAQIRAFERNADDYITKPFSLKLVLMRIEAVLRRCREAKASKDVLCHRNIRLDATGHAVWLDGDPVSLTLREFQILFKLLSNPNRAFTRSQLVDEFSGLESESGLRTVDVFIANLRSKFAHCADFKIVTVRGLGYKAVVS